MGRQVKKNEFLVNHADPVPLRNRDITLRMGGGMMAKLRGGTPIWRWRDMLHENHNFEYLLSEVYTDPEELIDQFPEMDLTEDERSDLDAYNDARYNCSICGSGLDMGCHALDVGFAKKAKQKWPTIILKRRYCSLYCADKDFKDKNSPIHEKPKKPKKRK
jgi:hypothetical protein